MSLHKDLLSPNLYSMGAMNLVKVYGNNNY